MEAERHSLEAKAFQSQLSRLPSLPLDTTRTVYEGRWEVLLAGVAKGKNKSEGFGVIA